MPHRKLFAAALLVCAIACGKSKSSTTDTSAVASTKTSADTATLRPMSALLNLSSSAFGANTPIPPKYTCEGANVSPPLAWSGAPSKAKSFALIVEDPDAPDPAKPTRVVTHWVAYNIPGTTSVLAENASKSGMPTGSAQGLNEGSKPVYMGPCPPIGSHRYFFKLYALDTVLTGLKNPKKADLQQAMQTHVVDSTQLIGTYQKTKK
ncbi:MAG TPA: YbhB/YbcL family Raf kinase inhibitor-like protein [Gemmatimonadaceae bacterium]|jgi:Raf kinase inhibitor-like YbhB/YbcL family protein|nr:YbhB/YbcL family Raf kinase inhibitor-like protein [Gemmatimonadaceae bacterium]